MNPTTSAEETAHVGPISGSDRLWAVLCHLSFFLGFGLILPLVAYLVMRKDTPYVAEQAREALNFHISVFLWAIGSAILIVATIGIFMLLGLAVLTTVASIIAAIKASEGIYYRYPLCIRFVS
jgi:uncharacterized Tic20 family protein